MINKIAFIFIMISLISILFSNYIRIFEFYSISGYLWLFHMVIIIVDSILLGYFIADKVNNKNKEVKEQ